FERKQKGTQPQEARNLVPESIQFKYDLMTKTANNIQFGKVWPLNKINQFIILWLIGHPELFGRSYIYYLIDGYKTRHALRKVPQEANKLLKKMKRAIKAMSGQPPYASLSDKEREPFREAIIKLQTLSILGLDVKRCWLLSRKNVGIQIMRDVGYNKTNPIPHYLKNTKIGDLQEAHLFMPATMNMGQFDSGDFYRKAKEWGLAVTDDVGTEFSHWRLLFSFGDSPNQLGWRWSERGQFQFWIRKDDLAANRFDRVMYVIVN
ncbi:MAG: DUF1963 domain-containing protein, partial [Pseudomonadota bacterium]